MSSMLQHNEVMDIRSKPTFVSCEHYLLFACLLSCLVGFLVCLFILLFVMSPATCCACHVYCVYLLYAYFMHILRIFLPSLVCWFLIFAFACTHMERGRLEMGHSLPSTSKKGADTSMSLSQAAVFNKFRSLAFPFWYCTLSSPYLLDGLY